MGTVIRLGERKAKSESKRLALRVSEAIADLIEHENAAAGEEIRMFEMTSSLVGYDVILTARVKPE
jgi:uncharacterized protein (DUF1778 family)